MAHDPLEHVLDQDKHWTIFDTLFGGFEIPLVYWENAFGIEGFTFRITKFMILELVAAALICAIFIPLARRMRGGVPPKGPLWNFLEGLLTFVRDDIAKPNLQEDTDRYTPFLWTVFLFILFCNLLGMIPTLGSPTASIFMTLGLAVFSLILFHAGAIAKLGFVPYLKSLWPQVEIVPYPGKKAPAHHDHHGHGGHGHEHHSHGPADHASEGPDKPVPVMAWFWWGVGSLFALPIAAMIFVIEFAGTFIKSAVLALRLFVNIFAGHMILASILVMVVVVGESVGFGWTWGFATLISVLGVTALSLLELFVAFLQAFVFTFLTALFLGMALHPSH